MIIVKFNTNFVKSYGKRIKNDKKLKIQVGNRIDLFKNDRLNSILKDHQLKGGKIKYRSFSITGDIRVIYYFQSENIAIFVDIGSHNQVYK